MGDVWKGSDAEQQTSLTMSVENNGTPTPPGGISGRGFLPCPPEGGRFNPPNDEGERPVHGRVAPIEALRGFLGMKPMLTVHELKTLVEAGEWCLIN